LAAAAGSSRKRSYGKYCAPSARFGKLGNSEDCERRFEEASGDVGHGMVGERQARVLAGRPSTYTLRFVAFANEEAAHHSVGTMGSEHYARRCVVERSERVVGMLSLEMVGYYRTERGSQTIPKALPRVTRHVFPKRGDFLAVVANPKSVRLLLRFWQGFRRSRPRFPVFPVALPELVHDIKRSDHRPFWDLGIPALMVTDTSFLRNPHYHQPSDTPDTLDYDRLTRATLGVAGGIGQLAGIRQPVVW
jgi:Zn-dependent M28 family amino/carboxypeptidase